MPSSPGRLAGVPKHPVQVRLNDDEISLVDDFATALSRQTYGVAFGTGLGDVAGKVFRIGHLGSLTDVMALSGIAAAEMVMVDLGLEVKLGSGVSAAQDHYRQSAVASQQRAA